MNGSKVLMLEDDAERVERFNAVLLSIAPALDLIVWDTAHRMIAEVDELLDDARFISLDHDLYTESDTDPGDGLDVAKFLADQPPHCPVIIHTTNSPRAVYMTGALELEGWQVARVVPLGEDWIEQDWRHVVMQVLSGEEKFDPQED